MRNVRLHGLGGNDPWRDFGSCPDCGIDCTYGFPFSAKSASEPSVKMAAALILLGLAANFLGPAAIAQDEHAKHSQHSPESMPMKHGHQMPMGPKDCSDSEVWDYSFGSCQPLNMGNAPMKMWMVHGNAFLVQTQRSASELAISGTNYPLDPKWVTALTAGYTYDFWKFGMGKLGAGLSVTKNFLPTEFRGAYGGDPWSGRVFIQITGMTMGEVK